MIDFYINHIYILKYESGNILIIVSINRFCPTVKLMLELKINVTNIFNHFKSKYFFLFNSDFLQLITQYE